jgi:hypothetical protein
MHLCPCHRVCGCVGVWVSGCGCLECVICDVRVLVCACVVHARLVSPLVRTQGVHQLEKAKQSQKDARKRMCCITCCCVILLFLAIGGVLTQFVSL